MYQFVTLEDEIAVPPMKFNMDLNKSVEESISEKIEGKIDNEIGIVLAVVDIEDVGEGKILPGDPSVHYPVKFKVLSWMPKNHEIVEGEIVDITEFGAFIRVGGFDGLIHISQVMDDFVSYDEKNGQLTGKQSHRILKEGDSARARIISISFKDTNKVGLTMRQPYLGSLKWSDAKVEEVKESKPKESKPKKKGK